MGRITLELRADVVPKTAGDRLVSCDDGVCLDVGTVTQIWAQLVDWRHNTALTLFEGVGPAALYSGVGRYAGKLCSRAFLRGFCHEGDACYLAAHPLLIALQSFENFCLGRLHFRTACRLVYIKVCVCVFLQSCCQPLDHRRWTAVFSHITHLLQQESCTVVRSRCCFFCWVL